MQGTGAPPEWYVLLMAAEAWGCKPWELEETAPALWMDRFVAANNAKAKRTPRAKPGSTRLI